MISLRVPQFQDSEPSKSADIRSIFVSFMTRLRTVDSTVDLIGYTIVNHNVILLFKAELLVALLLTRVRCRTIKLEVSC